MDQQQQAERDMLEAADWEQGHGSISCPTHNLWGDGDPILPITQAHRLVEDIPDSRLVILRGVGHVSQIESPDRVLHEILWFLEEIDR